MPILSLIKSTLEITASISVTLGILFYFLRRKHELQNQIKEKEKDIARALSSNIVEVTLGAKEDINNISKKILHKTNRKQYFEVVHLMEDAHYGMQTLQRYLPKEIKSRIKSTENTFMSKK